VNDEMTWIDQARHGSDEAFSYLVEMYQTPVYNLCHRMLGEDETAEDASQETFIKAYRNLGRYDANRSFATWLLSIAAHHCIDLLRRRKYPVFSMDEFEGDYELPDKNIPDPQEEVERREEQVHMQRMLNSLDATDRAAIILRYWNDCSEVEIARALSLTVPAVKSRLHRARHALASLVEQGTFHPGRRQHESPAF